MHEKKNISKPLGICQRLFHFIKSLVDPSLYKHITLGPPVPQGQSTTQFVLNKPNGKMRVQYQDHDENLKKHYSLGDEISIQFKQSKELGSWTSVDKKSSSPKDKEILKKVKEIPLVQNRTEGSQIEGKRPPLMGPKRFQSSRDKRTGTKESEEEEKIRKKGKSIQSDQNLTSPRKVGDTSANMTPKRFLTVAPNINEISDEFIRQRKLTMSKDVNL